MALHTKAIKVTKATKVTKQFKRLNTDIGENRSLIDFRLINR